MSANPAGPMPVRPRLARSSATPEYEIHHATTRRASDPQRSPSLRGRHTLRASTRPVFLPTPPVPFSPAMLEEGRTPLEMLQTPAAPAPQEDYFPLVRIATEPDRRRSSVAVFLAQRRASFWGAVQTLGETFNPNAADLVEPFSFESTRTSWWSSFNLTLGLLGQAGYTMGAACIEHNTVDIAPPPGVTAGVGGGQAAGPDGMPKWYAPPLPGSIAIFALGVLFGLTSSMLFLRDGLRIAGNKRKAYFYVTMHLIGIVLISLSRTIIDFRKNKTPHGQIIALTIPASLGRGLHWVTIPRSFSNSEVTRGDFARLTFDQRQKLSEGLRVVAAVFFGLWAGSWAVQDYNPLQREVWAIMGSLTLNVSAALPNTNLRRADIFRRSQQSAITSQLNTFRMDSPAIRTPPAQPPSRAKTNLPSPAVASQASPQTPHSASPDP